MRAVVLILFAVKFASAAEPKPHFVVENKCPAFTVENKMQAKKTTCDCGTTGKCDCWESKCACGACGRGVKPAVAPVAPVVQPYMMYPAYFGNAPACLPGGR